jgi:hypothetical protein
VKTLGQVFSDRILCNVVLYGFIHILKMLKNYNYERQQGQEIEFVELLEHDFLGPIVSFE